MQFLQMAKVKYLFATKSRILPALPSVNIGNVSAKCRMSQYHPNTGIEKVGKSVSLASFLHITQSLNILAEKELSPFFTNHHKQMINSRVSLLNHDD